MITHDECMEILRLIRDRVDISGQKFWAHLFAQEDVEASIELTSLGFKITLGDHAVEIKNREGTYFIYRHDPLGIEGSQIQFAAGFLSWLYDKVVDELLAA